MTTNEKKVESMGFGAGTGIGGEVHARSPGTHSVCQEDLKINAFLLFFDSLYDLHIKRPYNFDSRLEIYT